MLNAPNFTTCETESVKPPLALKKKQLTAAQLQQPKFKLGQLGEDRACQWLLSLGYQLLERNLRFKLHEIDLLMLDPQTQEIVVVEVKARQNPAWGGGWSAVNWRKIGSLQQVVRIYTRQHHLENDVRFDIICIWPNRLEHFKNVTW